MKNLSLILVQLLAVLSFAHADTPPSNSTKASNYSGDGVTPITATGNSLNVNVTNSGGTSTVNQGTGGSSAWLVSGTFFQSVQPVSQSGSFSVLQSGTWTTGRTWTLSNTTDSVNVGNFPTTQAVSGTFFQATQPVSAASLPLPSGASTSALQTTGNTSLATIATNTPALGQSTMSASVPVAIASNQSAIPVSGTITATNSANGATGSAVPSQATQIGGSDGTLLRAVKVSTAGVVSVDGSAVTQPVSAASLPLPSGASTSALQTTGNTSLASIATNTLAAGQATMTASSPVVIASNQSAIPVTGTFFQATQPVSGTFFQATQPVSGTVAATQSGTWSTGRTWSLLNSTDSVNVGNFPTTQAVSGTVTANAGTGTFAVSAASLPLPSGASTSALQTQISGQLPSTLGAKTTANSLAVNIASDQTVPVSGTFFQSTQPVSAASLPLPSGAATSANQSTEIASLASIDAGIPNALGAATKANSMPVNIASDQTVPVSGTLTSQVYTNGNSSNSVAVGATAVSFAPPTNAVGFVIEAESSNAVNLRYACGTTATATVGMLLEPGRDSGYIPSACTVTIISTSTTGQAAGIQWVLSQ